MHVLSRDRCAVVLSVLVTAAVLTLAGCAAPAASKTQGTSPVAGTAAPNTQERPAEQGGQSERPTNGGVATFISAGRIDMPGVPVPPGAETRMTAAQQVQVARALLVPYLEQFKRPEAPVGLRLRDYRFSDNDIHLVQGTFSPLVFSIRFTILPEDPKAPGWLAGSGAPQPDGWIQDKLLIMTIVARDGAYHIRSVDPYLGTP